MCWRREDVMTLTGSLQSYTWCSHTIQNEIVDVMNTDSLEIQELFFGFYETDSTTSSALVIIMCDVLAHFGLPIRNSRD
ncbi:hypothetical protein PR048_019546 [Dryococelus australis]|uniref:Uncharacterized protein n=1 Tax=Dryococelus australis TaxID=614101 RepID=A0ABQ9H3R6_9NEOP|nr:hypothetical protein PR048_019546 [Dryococelus australis]